MAQASQKLLFLNGGKWPPQSIITNMTFAFLGFQPERYFVRALAIAETDLWRQQER
jgi:hypothetical protein